MLGGQMFCEGKAKYIKWKKLNIIKNNSHC